jgi:L-alanine-DL-glutamate epimerase-like enolase superfamily enzyme
MKIKRVTATIVNLPADEPLTGAVVSPGSVRPHVLVEIETDEGAEGIGFTFFGARLTGALRAAVEALGELIIGDDPLAIGAIRAKCAESASGAGPEGIYLLALSAIDFALWDIKGKAFGQPLWRLLGGDGQPVPTYASGALMRGLDLKTTLASAGKLIEAGFREVKMQLALPGETTPAREIEQARLVREAVGPDVRLMCDINQRWRVDEAISIGRRLEDIGFFWLEDIAAPDDYPGLARIAAALATPLAGGEYVYGLAPFRHMLEAGSVDIAMVDPFRVGGISNWLKAAAIAEGFNLPVVSHLAPEIQVHLIGAVPNGLTLEFMPWSVALFDNPPWPEKGMLTPPNGPGLGLSLNRKAVERYRA